METEFGKVVGGFTSLKWLRNNQYLSAVNDIKNNFLFSFTNNDIFTMIAKNAQNCIHSYVDNSYGPCFGGGHDLCIYNKANYNNTSYANIGSTYTNLKYVCGDTNSRINFTGGYNFKIK